MKRLILFSGGVESTALLTLSLPDDVVMVVLPTGEQLTCGIEDVVKVSRSMHRNVTLATIYAGMMNPGNPVYQLYWLLAVASVRVMQDPGITHVWYGMHAGEPHANRIQEDFIRLKTAWSVLHPTVVLEWPLYHLTKEEQWELIPPFTKRLVRNCDFVRECGFCPKCKELKALPGSFWDCS